MRKQSMIASASVAAVASALVVGLVVGLGVPQPGSPTSAPSAQDRSYQVATVAGEAPYEPGTETLPAEQASELTDGEVEEILEVSEEAVADAQEEFATDASPADYDKAVAAFAEISAQLDQIIADEGVEGLAERFPENVATADTAFDRGDGFAIETAAQRCLTVYKWQLQTIAWIAIGYGAFVSIAALFAGAVTIVGLPAGAVVSALGIGLGVVGSFFLWKVDQQRWNSKRVCF